MDFEGLQEISGYLGLKQDTLKLQRLQALYEGGKFFVAFWGHYSAGKSRLINNVLGRDILPVKVKETTPALTYIQYGDKEFASLIYNNGETEAVSLEMVRELFQHTSGKNQVRLERTDHIEVYLNNPLLERGLVLVDTPGVNTIIQKHQDMAVSTIDNLGRIIYVLGGSVSNVDREFISRIISCGIKITFIRTKCDKFNTDEEDPETALEKEKEKLNEICNSQVEYYLVSNEPQCEKWFSNMKNIVGLLEGISKRTKEELEKSCLDQRDIYRSRYIKLLEENINELNNIVSGRSNEVKDKIRECEKKIGKLEKLADRQETDLKEKLEKSKRCIQRVLPSVCSSSIDDFVNKMESMTPSPQAASDIEVLYSREVNSAVRKLQGVFNEYLDSVVTEEQSLINDIMEDVGLDIDEAPSYVEIEQMNSQVLEQYRSKLLQIKSELTRLNSEKKQKLTTLQNLEDKMQESEYEDAIKELDEQLEQIPSGMALCVSSDQPIQPSSVFKKVGQAADLALLLLPGDAIVAGVKGAVDATKVAQILHKTGKVGEVILNTGKIAAQNANAIDKARDTFYIVASVFSKRKYSSKAEKAKAQKLIDAAAAKAGEAYEGFKESKRSGNVLDMLSVAYWTEKLGSKFDIPPRMEIDTAEEERRRQLRSEIISSQIELSSARMQKKKELGLLETEAKRLEMEEQEKITVQQAVEKEMQKHEAELKINAQKQALEDFKRKYSNYFESNIKLIADSMLNGYFRSANQNITLYVTRQSSQLAAVLKDEKDKLNSLLQINPLDESGIGSEMNNCKKYIVYLESLVQHEG